MKIKAIARFKAVNVQFEIGDILSQEQVDALGKDLEYVKAHSLAVEVSEEEPKESVDISGGPTRELASDVAPEEVEEEEEAPKASKKKKKG